MNLPNNLIEVPPVSLQSFMLEINNNTKAKQREKQGVTNNVKIYKYQNNRKQTYTRENQPITQIYASKIFVLCISNICSSFSSGRDIDCNSMWGCRIFHHNNFVQPLFIYLFTG